jgi:hypothetical protein
MQQPSSLRKIILELPCEFLWFFDTIPYPTLNIDHQPKFYVYYFPLSFDWFFKLYIPKQYVVSFIYKWDDIV